MQKLPEMPDERPVMIFDGVCVLCSATVAWIIRHDPKARIAFSNAQGPLGQAVYAGLGLSTEAFDTFLLVRNGRVLTRSAGFIAIMEILGWPWRTLTIIRLVPRPLRDWVYDRIAKNRYRWFGKTGTCMVPDATVTSRFL